MVKEMDDGEFWLPSDFLTDDLFAGGERVSETESDEDDPVAGITRQLTAQSLITDDRKNPEPSVMATSPQSTLCGIGSWSFSSDGSPEGTSQVSSPPSTPFQPPTDDALDLLHAAAGEVERLGLSNDSSQGLLGPPQDHSFQIQSATKSHKIGGFNSDQVLNQQQLQAARFYQLRQQQLLKQQQQYSAWGRNQNRASTGVRPLGLSKSAWPPLQKTQQPPPLPGSGMTAVYLNGGRRQSTGTGVFLPRRVGPPSLPKKKPACSTVLLPAKVVQALNLNLSEMDVHPRLPGYYVVDNDAAVSRSHKRNQSPAEAAATATSPELRLPKEWTY